MCIRDRLTCELYFPFAPRLLLAAGKEGKGGDVVIAKLCHWLIIGICQDHLGALVVYLSNWGELIVADN